MAPRNLVVKLITVFSLAGESLLIYVHSNCSGKLGSTVMHYNTAHLCQ